MPNTEALRGDPVGCDDIWSAGLARTDITAFERGVTGVAGWTRPDLRLRGVATPIHARALVVRHADQVIAIACIELCFVSGALREVSLGVGAQGQSRQDRGHKNPNSHPNRVRSRHSKFGHSVEDVACKSSLDRLPIRITRMQLIAKDQLVAHERVLSTRLLMIARLLLPLPPATILTFVRQ